MSEHNQHMKQWVASFRDDVAVVRQVVEAEALARPARRWAAAALNYLVTRLDLVPDWEEGIGVLDDAIVLRVCMAQASEQGIEPLDARLQIAVARLANESEHIVAMVGPELAAALRAHCERLLTQPVRQRTADLVLGDAEARAALLDDVAHELERIPTIKLPDPEVVERQLRSYLTAKLT